METAKNHKTKSSIFYAETLYTFTSLCRKERKARNAILDFSDRTLNGDFSCNYKNRVNGEKWNNWVDTKISRIELADILYNCVTWSEVWANTLSNIVLLLAMHPEAQDHLYKETREMSEKDLKDFEIIENLNYLDLVQKEVNRMLPSVPIVVYKPFDDFILNNEHEHEISKNTDLVLNYYAFGRKTDVWGEDADQFKPERFQHTNLQQQKWTYSPFTTAEKLPAASKFSRMSLKVAVIKLVQNFTFKTTMKMEDVRLKSFLSLELCTQHSISVECR